MADSHVILPGSRRPASSDGIRLRDVDPNTRIDIRVTLKGPDLPAIGMMPPKALSQAESEKKFGVPAEAVLKVERLLGAFGFKVRAVK